MPRISAETANKGGEARKPTTKAKVESTYFQATLNMIEFTGKTNWAGAESVYLEIGIPDQSRPYRVYFDSPMDADGNILEAVEATRDRMNSEGKNGDKWFEIQCSVWNRIAESMDPEVFPLGEDESIADHIRDQGYDWDDFLGQGIGVGFLGYLDVDEEHRQLAADTKVLFPTLPGEFNSYNNKFRSTLNRTLVSFDSVPGRRQAGKTPIDERMQVIEARTQKAESTPSGSNRKAPPKRKARKVPPRKKA